MKRENTYDALICQDIGYKLDGYKKKPVRIMNGKPPLQERAMSSNCNVTIIDNISKWWTKITLWLW